MVFLDYVGGFGGLLVFLGFYCTLSGLFTFLFGVWKVCFVGAWQGFLACSDL